MGYGKDGLWDWGEQEKEDRKRAIKERNARLTRQENERVEKLKAESARRSKLHNGRMMLDEYRRADVEPLSLDEDGHPNTPLDSLRWLGWTIEQVDGRNVLVEPKKEKRSKKATG